ncbi:hypothetical protein C8A05DRAFT_30392 [Staphylotrichum tortipilum]|uniref:RING-type domain-containing protein n=1 Tax=Staphylotrichum tortipilum TaxID=2831512 RepID=A0AAN6RX73_9PEZI|nr:hypothetical protein C8A05DRAFT_30392 [Staphylotrichum longicolle]
MAAMVASDAPPSPRVGGVIGMLVFVVLGAWMLSRLGSRGPARNRAHRRWALTALLVRKYDPESAGLPVACPPVPFWRRLLLFYFGRALDAAAGLWHLLTRRHPSSPARAAANACPSPGSEDAASCAVCRNDLVRGDRVRHLLCGHIFHAPCIGAWLVHGVSPTCPLW